MTIQRECIASNTLHTRMRLFLLLRTHFDWICITNIAEKFQIYSIIYASFREKLPKLFGRYMSFECHRVVCGIGRRCWIAGIHVAACFALLPCYTFFAWKSHVDDCYGINWCSSCSTIHMKRTFIECGRHFHLICLCKICKLSRPKNHCRRRQFEYV